MTKDAPKFIVKIWLIEPWGSHTSFVEGPFTKLEAHRFASAAILQGYGRRLDEHHATYFGPHRLEYVEVCRAEL